MPRKIQPKIESIILALEDGSLLETRGWEFSHVAGAILRTDHKYTFILLMSGRKLCDFDTLDECVSFWEHCHKHPKVFFGTADMEDMFERAGGREPFIKAVQQCVTKARKTK